MTIKDVVDDLKAWLADGGLDAFRAFAFDSALGVLMTIIIGAVLIRYAMILILPNFIAGPGGALFDTERGQGALDFFVKERREDV